jgi:hypothetical protein
MGLTGGFADVGSLYDCLMGIHWGVADERILEKYSEVRIMIWQDLIDVISRGNFRRLWDEGEEAEKERQEFWELCHQADKSPEDADKFADVSGLQLRVFTVSFTKTFAERT